MEVTTHSTQETRKLAQQIAKKLKPGNVLALYGDLGAGKTTFTRFLVEALGIKKRVQSPTFVIVRKYQDPLAPGLIKTVNHIDLYRVTTPKEVSELGLDEIFDEEGAVSVIEWPEVMGSELPAEAIKVKFEYIDQNVRSINVQD